MNDKQEQWPPIEGDNRSGVAVIVYLVMSVALTITGGALLAVFFL